jgi:hypothetical protein
MGGASGAWDGWWVKYDNGSYVRPTEITTLGEDLILHGVVGMVMQGYDPERSYVNLGPEAPLPSDGTFGFLARISSEGETLWARELPYGFGTVVTDVAGRIHVALVTASAGESLVVTSRLRTYDGSGTLLAEHLFGDAVVVRSLAPLADGGLLVGLNVDLGGTLALPSGAVELEEGPNAVNAVVARLDADGGTVWWKQASVSHGLTGVAEDGDGMLFVLVAAVSAFSWGDTLIAATADGVATLALDPTGELQWDVGVSGYPDGSRLAASRGSGALLSGAIHAGRQLIIDGAPVYGPLDWKEDSQGVVVRLTGTGQLADVLTTGKGNDVAAVGSGKMVAASHRYAAPLALSWCGHGSVPCDEYSLAETETTSNCLSVTPSGAAVYMAGSYRPVDASKPSQLYVMRLEH